MNPSDLHIRFGECDSIGEPSRAFDGYVYRPARVRISDSATDDSSLVLAPDLAEVTARHFPDRQIAAGSSCDAPWARGRIQSLFHLNQDADVLHFESWIDGQTYREKAWMHFTFLCTVVDRGVNVGVPFICADNFGQSCLRFGRIPVRSGAGHAEMIAGIAASFWKLLLADPDPIPDYEDTAMLGDMEIRFGMKSNIPFCEWPE